MSNSKEIKPVPLSIAGISQAGSQSVSYQNFIDFIETCRKDLRRHLWAWLCCQVKSEVSFRVTFLGKKTQTSMIPTIQYSMIRFCTVQTNNVNY